MRFAKVLYIACIDGKETAVSVALEVAVERVPVNNLLTPIAELVAEATPSVNVPLVAMLAYTEPWLVRVVA
jgi:hypothetical protein